MVLPVRTIPFDWRRRKYMPNQKSLILRNVLQKGFVIILNSHGGEPFKFWELHPGNGRIQRVRNPDVDGLVVELISPTFCSTYISVPEDVRSRTNCTMPILTLMLEYLNRPFAFEIQLKDSKNMKRKYRMSTCRTNSKLSTVICHLPIYLTRGWNKIIIDLPSLTRLSYNSRFVEFLGMKVYSSCRIRKIYFSDRKYEENELPEELILREHIPLHRGPKDYPFNLYPANLYRDGI
ncbi:cilia- and flagella-associated protein 20 [Trichonephila clavata]|uniref:Cilia- and flagella-associated protein 20 n=1 Tax=Trichonephila clavata TaxID=2740835 RepID=A0A8X6GU72_TRICU|nr:cilia- and flagella-associated protein 20 [Trichonephila clavata]